MFVALRADVGILLQILFPGDLMALLTFHPQSFGLDFFFA
jgi:hypothetical protein